MDLRRLRLFLEKHLKRLQKSTATSAVVAGAPPSLKTNLSIKTNDSVKSDVAACSSRVLEPINEFETKKTELFDRCERKISELGRMCRNLSHFKKATRFSRVQRQANERELRRQELIRRLILAEAEEREVLIAIGMKGRELRRALINDNATIASSGETLAR